MDTRKIFSSRRFWAGILLAQFVLFYILSGIAYFVNVAAAFFEYKKAAHQKFASLFPFSVGDIFYIVIAAGLILFLIKLLNKKSRKKATLSLFISVNLFYFIYQLFWGMLYFQAPLSDRLPKREITVIRIKALATKYLEKCRKTRTLVEEDENGVFTFNNTDLIKSEILNRQNNLPELFNTKSATQTDAFKPSLYRSVISYSGILGYYNPFTSEAQYNDELPHTYIPFTLAHESAHQLGFAREQEANFVGYLIGRNSDNAALRYSTEYAVLKSLLNSLAEEHKPFVDNILSQYSAGMKRDRQTERDFIQKHKGPLDVFFGITNDLFLKSNQQDGSVTYSYFVDLLLRYEDTE